METRGFVDLRRTAVRMPTPDRHFGADELPCKSEGGAVSLRERRRRLFGQVSQVPLQRPAAGRVEVDPARTRARAQEVACVRRAVQVALEEIQALELGAQLA